MNSPLSDYSGVPLLSAIHQLDPSVQKWIHQQKWRELRDIQTRAISTIFGCDSDLILSASTAAGKTEAAFLPLISQVLQSKITVSGFDLLYIGPLKALISDQSDRLEGICRLSELPVFPWHGDVKQSIKKRAMQTPKGILLITPESLEALFIRCGSEIPRLFHSTRAVVIDELHTLFDRERGVQVLSLLSRLEHDLDRSIRRIGLSATLGDLNIAKSYLRPGSTDNIAVIKSEKEMNALKLQLRTYTSGPDGESSKSANSAIAEHIFQHLRGSNNLVFAGSRQNAEEYADLLRNLCENSHVPQEFLPHHANLSREHRNYVENRLKTGIKPTTAICTSTLELGIDIGDVQCVAQIGAPFSVSSLRQRLGRSGRRKGQPAILRQYVNQANITFCKSLPDLLRLDLIRSIAMIELLLDGWCESNSSQSLHLSTLVHQILSFISQKGGATASSLFQALCLKGAFQNVTQQTLVRVLRALGHPDINLIEQSDSGLLLLGAQGEYLVEHYSFYAVFESSDEYRLISDGHTLGTIPINSVVSPGIMIIFSGKRWVITEIDDRTKVIIVKASGCGAAPKFSTRPGNIHDTVVERMFELLETTTEPIYIDNTSKDMLQDARACYEQMGLKSKSAVRSDLSTWILATRTGTIKTSTLALALKQHGFLVTRYDGFIQVVDHDNNITLPHTLRIISTDIERKFSFTSDNLIFEKFHPYLTRDLLELDALSSRIDLVSLPQLAAELFRECCEDTDLPEN